MAKRKNDKKIHAMMCIVVSDDDQILILHRSPNKKYFPNLWAPVGAAPLDENENMKAIAKRELIDEIGMYGKIINKGNKFETKAEGLLWTIYPFVAKVDSKDVKLNEEHTEYKWVRLEELGSYELTPNFEKLVKEFFEHTVRSG